jgi:hypothetical protein
VFHLYSLSPAISAGDSRAMISYHQNLSQNITNNFKEQDLINIYCLNGVHFKEHDTWYKQTNK